MAHWMKQGANGELASYREWISLAPGIVGPSLYLFPAGHGGVLYPILLS